MAIKLDQLTTAEAMSHPDVALTINKLGKMADGLRTQNQALVEALEDATDEIESWGAYASEYFQAKHDLAGNVAKFRAIAQAEGEV